MKALTYREFGAARDALRMADLEIEEPREGEVLVRVAFSGVNPSDVKARAGSRPGVTKPPFPVIVPHSDGSGVIEAVGPGVDAARIGERVWIWNGQWQRAFGTAAEYVTLPAQQAVALPEGASLEVGAVLGIPGLTAAHCVFGGGDIAGKTMFISGGGGTVGYLAVQLAKWGGAKVITTASEGDHARLLAAGADHVFDYRSENLAMEVLAATHGRMVDAAVEVEFGQNVGLLADIVAPNARVAVYGSARNMTPELPFGPLLFKALTLDIVLIYLLPAPERQQAISRLNAALAADALTVPIAEIFDLDAGAAAHEMVENGARSGAVLLRS